MILQVAISDKPVENTVGWLAGIKRPQLGNTTDVDHHLICFGIMKADMPVRSSDHSACGCYLVGRRHFASSKKTVYRPLAQPSRIRNPREASPPETVGTEHPRNQDQILYLQ